MSVDVPSIVMMPIFVPEESTCVKETTEPPPPPPPTLVIPPPTPRASASVVWRLPSVIVSKRSRSASHITLTILNVPVMLYIGKTTVMLSPSSQVARSE